MFDQQGFEPSGPASDDSALSVTGARARVLMRMADAALGALAQIDAADLSPEDQRDVTLGLERLHRVADATAAHTLAELDSSGITDLRHGLTTSKWLADRAGLPSGVARRRLGIAKKLAVLPEVDAALSQGLIGIDHVRVLTDAVNARNHADMCPLLGDLIDAASGTVFARWSDDVRALGALLDPDGSHDPDDLSRNRLTLSPSDDFMLLRGELVGEHALSVHDTLNAIADELFHQHRLDHAECPELEVPDRSTLMALALEEVCRRALGIDSHSTKAPRVEATLTIHTNLDPHPGLTSNSSVVGAAWQIHDRLGTRIPAATIPAFLCDATFHAALLDSLGLPVDMGRAVRTVTPAQRRALVVRDGGCTFPGCDGPAAWTDAHHIRYWNRDRGSTDLDNLALVCRRHHRVAHRRGWGVTLGGDGYTRWSTPRGSTHIGQRHHQRAGP